jgi:hypothetical protein
MVLLAQILALLPNFSLPSMRLMHLLPLFGVAPIFWFLRPTDNYYPLKVRKPYF